MAKQFIINILEAKQDANGSFETIDPATLANASVVAEGNPETGDAFLPLGKGSTGLAGQYYAAFYDTYNKRYTGQLSAIAPFQIEGQPDFDPKTNVTDSGVDVTNGSSADSSASSSSASSASSSESASSSASSSSSVYRA